MSKPAIEVEGLSKAYRIGLKEEAHETLVSAAASWVRAPLRNWNRLRRLGTSGSCGEEDDIVWALDDVSFTVRQGEVVGVIGRNGAGKSTLLKILSRIVEPTRGRAVIRGRVSSLLEVGTGFHPELTGRDNVYMNGTILGMTKREIDRKFDEIVAFSGVEKFLDTPIKRYSSGMKVRLAFSVAAHLEPEILIIDEVLAVGDAEFQRRCVGKMRDVAHDGRTVLFVSHNAAALEALCHTGIRLRSGRLAGTGPIADVLAEYQQSTHGDQSGPATDAFAGAKHFKRAYLLSETGSPTSWLTLGSRFHLRLELDSSQTLHRPQIGVGIDSLLGERMITAFTPKAGIVIKEIDDECLIDCVIDQFPLRPGTYSVKLDLSVGRMALDTLENALEFTVTDADAFGDGWGFHRGVCIAPSRWLYRQVTHSLESPSDVI